VVPAIDVQREIPAHGPLRSHPDCIHYPTIFKAIFDRLGSMGAAGPRTRDQPIEGTWKRAGATRPRREHIGTWTARLKKTSAQAAQGNGMNVN
jgi:hypothetical protein